MSRPLNPVFVGGIALAIAVTNLLTIRIPADANPAGSLIGLVGVPIVVTVVYTIWYLRRYGRD